MKKLTFTSWETCKRQETFILLLCQLAALGVNRARGVVQRVLAQRPVTLELPDKVANELRAQAEAIGVVCAGE